jgi:hypothetical protein
VQRNSICKTCGWTRTCAECQRITRAGVEFAAQFSLDALTFVAYTDWRSLPDASGIYFALGPAQEVIYIGQTQSLYQRWLCGNYRAFYHYDVETIGFVLAPNVILWRLSAERELIKRFQPSMHGIRKPPGPKLKEWQRLVGQTA